MSGLIPRDTVGPCSARPAEVKKVQQRTKLTCIRTSTFTYVACSILSVVTAPIGFISPSERPCPSAGPPMGTVTSDAWSSGIHPWNYGQVNVAPLFAIAQAKTIARGGLWVSALFSNMAELWLTHVPTSHRALPVRKQPNNSFELHLLNEYEYSDHNTKGFLPMLRILLRYALCRPCLKRYRWL